MIPSDSEIKRCSSWSLLQPTVNYNTHMQFCREGIFSFLPIPHSGGTIPLEGENLRVSFGDSYGMLEMSGVTAIGCYDGPVIVQDARFFPSYRLRVCAD